MVVGSSRIHLFHLQYNPAQNQVMSVADADFAKVKWWQTVDNWANSQETASKQSFIHLKALFPLQKSSGSSPDLSLKRNVYAKTDTVFVIVVCETLQ